MEYALRNTNYSPLRLKSDPTERTDGYKELNQRHTKPEDRPRSDFAQRVGS